MKKEDLKLASKLTQELHFYSQTRRRLPGIEDGQRLSTLVFQMIESIRRIRFIDTIGARRISPQRLDPNSDIFDPVRASMLLQRKGDTDEAGWLLFLFTHFGKNRRSGYRLIQDVYSQLGKGVWNWSTVSKNPDEFRFWLDRHHSELRSGSVHRAFGNHRKYQSLSAWKKNGTGAAVESYVRLVQNSGGHRQLFENASNRAKRDPEATFKILYQVLDGVESFGRTAKFDYLTMVGKTGLAAVKPDSVHFQGATGPIAGAKLLFFGNQLAPATAAQLQAFADDLAAKLNIDKQVMEDSLCNWQKSPNLIERFRG